jgi:hypothetical protein
VKLTTQLNAVPSLRGRGAMPPRFHDIVIDEAQGQFYVQNETTEQVSVAVTLQAYILEHWQSHHTHTVPVYLAAERTASV